MTQFLPVDLRPFCTKTKQVDMSKCNKYEECCKCRCHWKPKPDRPSKSEPVFFPSNKQTSEVFLICYLSAKMNIAGPNDPPNIDSWLVNHQSTPIILLIKITTRLVNQFNDQIPQACKQHLQKSRTATGWSMPPTSETVHFGGTYIISRDCIQFGTMMK